MTADMDGYITDEAAGQNWRLLLGDSCERLGELAAETVDLSVHSPPFDSLYTYSDSPRDLGNSATREEFLQHYSYVIRHLYRLTRPGRLACVHVMDLSTTKATHGVTGLTDFSGQVTAAYQAEGWVYMGRITIRKNPQAAAQRTHAQGLAFAQLRRDRSMTRPVHPDYMLILRRPGDNAVPINSPITGLGDTADNDLWIGWAEAIWDDIRETRTLNVAVAREQRDERHICPLSLDIVERCVRLWSNPGELVLSPCAGIGSEGVGAIRYGRRYIGVELKPSYWRTAVANLRGAERDADAPMLFDDPAEVTG